MGRKSEGAWLGGQGFVAFMVFDVMDWDREESCVVFIVYIAREALKSSFVKESICLFLRSSTIAN